MFSTAICLTIMFGSQPLFDTEHYPYDRVAASFYMGFYRLGWSAGLAWIVLACICGYGGELTSGSERTKIRRKHHTLFSNRYYSFLFFTRWKATFFFTKLFGNIFLSNLPSSSCCRPCERVPLLAPLYRPGSTHLRHLPDPRGRAARGRGHHEDVRLLLGLQDGTQELTAGCQPVLQRFHW